MLKSSSLYFFLFFLFILSGCANNISQNSVNYTNRTISGGVYRDQKWDDEMKFVRVSWYQELTMVYDVFFHRLDPRTPFHSWFSPEELKEVEQCKEVIIVFHYGYDSKRIPDRLFKDEMSSNKFDEIIISTFAKNLKMHPDNIKWNLVKHKVTGFCRKLESTDPLIVNFPSFKEAVVNL